VKRTFYTSDQPFHGQNCYSTIAYMVNIVKIVEKYILLTYKILLAKSDNKFVAIPSWAMGSIHPAFPHKAIELHTVTVLTTATAEIRWNSVENFSGKHFVEGGGGDPVTPPLNTALITVCVYVCSCTSWKRATNFATRSTRARSTFDLRPTTSWSKLRSFLQQLVYKFISAARRNTWQRRYFRHAANVINSTYLVHDVPGPVVKVRGLGGSQPPAPIWAPCNSMSPPDWIYKVLFYA